MRTRIIQDSEITCGRRERKRASPRSILPNKIQVGCDVSHQYANRIEKTITFLNKKHIINQFLQMYILYIYTRDKNISKGKIKQKRKTENIGLYCYFNLY